MSERLRELAQCAAFEAHCEGMGQHNGTFDECPNADCVLVRAAPVCVDPSVLEKLEQLPRIRVTEPLSPYEQSLKSLGAPITKSTDYWKVEDVRAALHGSDPTREIPQ